MDALTGAGFGRACGEGTSFAGSTCTTGGIGLPAFEARARAADDAVLRRIDEHRDAVAHGILAPMAILQIRHLVVVVLRVLVFSVGPRDEASFESHGELDLEHRLLVLPAERLLRRTTIDDK